MAFRYQYTAALMIGACVSLWGCQKPGNGPGSASAPTGPPSGVTGVVAQGQLLPAKGIVQLFAQPGDPVADLLVAVGDDVEAGEPLAIMKSLELQTAQTESLREQRDQAQRSQQAAIEVAMQRLSAAKLRLEQVSAQATALTRRESVMSIAQEQVAAARGVLGRLERIASEPRTAEFIGKLEVERQRIQVRDAELKYREQEVAREQAADEIEWAKRMAQAEIEAAQTQLRLAQESSAVKVLDLQLSAAQLQSQASQLVAPHAGRILVIHATEGEAAVQRPVVEMADLSQMVCEVEINEADAARIAKDQPATIRSRAFPDTLRGTVIRKFTLVGRPQLRSLDPLAPADYRTVTATIELDAASSELARDWLQLQVEVTIETAAASSSTAPSAAKAR